MNDLELETILIGGLAGLVVACVGVWLGAIYVRAKLLKELEPEPSLEPDDGGPKLVVPESTNYVDPRTYLQDPQRAAQQLVVASPVAPSPVANAVPLALTVQPQPIQPEAVAPETVAPQTIVESPVVESPIAAEPLAEALQRARIGQQRAEIERDRAAKQVSHLTREVRLLSAELRRAEVRDAEVTSRWQDSEQRLASSEAGLLVARKEIDDIRGYVLQLSSRPGEDDVIDLR